MPGAGGTATRNTDALRARRREAILDKLLTAVEQLTAAGEPYAELSVERLISTAGVNRSTFYSYFDDKTALLLAMAEQALEQMLETAGDWYRMPARASKADMHRAIGRVVDAYIAHHAVMAAVADAADRSQALSKTYETLMDRSTTAMAAYIRRGQAEKFMDPKLDPDHTAAWLMWMSEGGLAMQLGRADPADRKRLHAGLTDIFWRGLRMGAR